MLRGFQSSQFWLLFLTTCESGCDDFSVFKKRMRKATSKWEEFYSRICLLCSWNFGERGRTKRCGTSCTLVISFEGTNFLKGRVCSNRLYAFVPFSLCVRSFADLVLEKVKTIINIHQKWTMLPTMSLHFHINGFRSQGCFHSVMESYLTDVFSPFNVVLGTFPKALRHIRGVRMTVAFT